MRPLPYTILILTLAATCAAAQQVVPQAPVNPPAEPFRPSQVSQPLATINGEIIALRQVAIRDSAVKHQIVRLRTQRGNLVAIDAGPVNRVQTAGLRPGTQLAVTGKLGRVRGNYVMLAERLQIDGRSIHVRDTGNIRVQGRIVGARDVPLTGTTRQNRLLLVHTQQGRLAIDLGDTSQLKGLNLDQGTQIKAEGRVVDVQGRPVLIANAYKAGPQQPMRIVERQRRDLPGFIPQRQARRE